MCAVELAACGSGGGDDAPPGPPSAIHDGMGWRTVATLPEPPDPAAGHWNYSIIPTASDWLGDVNGRLHVAIGVMAIGGGYPVPFDPGWLSFDAEGDPKPTPKGTTFLGGSTPSQNPVFVLDQEDALYQWLGADFTRVSWPAPDSMQTEVVFDFNGIVPPAGGYPVYATTRSVNRQLDIAVALLEEITGWPTLMSKPHDGPPMNYAISHRELVQPRAFGLVYGVNDPYDPLVASTQLFTPTDGPSYVFQVGTYYAVSMRYQQILHVFAPGTEPLNDLMRTDPRYKVLRRLQSVPLDPMAEAHLLATPTRAWVVVVAPAAPWRVYRFDRATQQLVLESTFSAPLDATTVNSWAATDDGTLYLTATGPRVLRLANGVATELWSSAIAKNENAQLGTLYSTGARVYLPVFDHYPITFTAGDDQTFDYYRFSYVTPDVPAVPTPEPITITGLVPASSCNPITNAPCASGQACDVGASPNGFTCAAEGSVAVCGACNPNGGPYCAAGSVCVLQSADPAAGKCMRTCCDYTDCGGPTTSCQSQYFSSVGVCYTGTGALTTAACSGFPTVPPSGGACGG
jgi:hypothetical protein